MQNTFINIVNLLENNIVQVSVILYIIIMICIGIFMGNKIKNTSDYVLAGRSLPFYVAFFTVFATWFGSESMLGASSKFVEGGFSNVLEDPFGAALCLIIAGIFFNRKLYRLKHLTIGDYFKDRYNKYISIFLSTAIVLSYFGWVAAQMLALGIIVSTLFVINLKVAIIISAIVTILYTYFGGMKSIAVLDTIQSFVIIVGLLAVLFTVLPLVGGMQNLIASTPAEFFQILPSENNIISWSIFLTAIMTIAFGSIPQQDIYQRAMSAKSENISVWASVSAGVFYFFIVMIPITIAMISKNIYPEIFTSDTQALIPHIVSMNTNLLIQILFFGALISAILSTASGAMLAPATIISENIIGEIMQIRNKNKNQKENSNFNFYKEEVKESKESNVFYTEKIKILIIKMSVLLVALVAVLFALDVNAKIYELVGNAYSVTLVCGFIPLAFGLYSKKFINSFGAMLSIISGASGWLITTYYYNIMNLNEESVIPATMIGFVSSLIAIILGSYLSNIYKNKYTNVLK